MSFYCLNVGFGFDISLLTFNAWLVLANGYITFHLLRIRVQPRSFRQVLFYSYTG